MARRSAASPGTVPPDPLQQPPPGGWVWGHHGDQRPQTSSLGGNMPRKVSRAPHPMGSAPLWTRHRGRGDRDIPAQGTLWGPWSPSVTLPMGVHTGMAKHRAGALVSPGPCPRPGHTKAAAVSRHPPLPSPSPPSPAPFTLLLPGHWIKARTRESRGTKGRNKGGWSCSALPVAPGPEQRPGDGCPACTAHGAPELAWGRGMPLGPRGPQ